MIQRIKMNKYSMGYKWLNSTYRGLVVPRLDWKIMKKLNAFNHDLNECSQPHKIPSSSHTERGPQETPAPGSNGWR